MMLRSSQLAAAFVVFALAAGTPVSAGTDGQLADARQLYAGAAYNDALSVLDSLLAVEQPREARQSIELYRTLCLVALGRSADADEAVQAMIERDPLYRPASDDVPPRVRTAFTEARKRILPMYIQESYLHAKAAYDRGELREAADLFARTLRAMADPDVATEMSRPPLADLKTLADGFAALSAQALAPPPPPVVVEPELPRPVPGRVYAADDVDVVPPVAVRQRMPPFRGRVAAGAGVVEVVIGLTGLVESARMAVPLGNAPYDQFVLNAAKSWQYEPATVGGLPVRFRKLVKVNLLPTPPE